MTFGRVAGVSPIIALMTTSELLLLGIVLFVLIDFSAGMVINYLNERSKNQPISPEGAEIFNPDEYAKSMGYGTTKYLSLIHISEPTRPY